MSGHNVNLRLTANKGSVIQLNFADMHTLNLYNRKLLMSLSDLRTFGLQNLRNEEPFISDLRTFGLESVHRVVLSVYYFISAEGN